MEEVKIFKNGTTSISGKKVAKLMGQKVMVSAYFQRRSNYSTKTKTWIKVTLPEPRPGWIVGARRIFNGKIEFQGWEEGNLFYPSESVPALLVTYWPMEKEVRVPLDTSCVRLWEEGDPEPFSSSFGDTARLRRLNTEEAQKALKEGWCPRDERGRFREMTPEEIKEISSS